MESFCNFEIFCNLFFFRGYNYFILVNYVWDYGVFFKLFCFYHFRIWACTVMNFHLCSLFWYCFLDLLSGNFCFVSRALFKLNILWPLGPYNQSCCICLDNVFLCTTQLVALSLLLWCDNASLICDIVAVRYC